MCLENKNELGNIEFHWKLDSQGRAALGKSIFRVTLTVNGGKVLGNV